jgi:hypothetical protein
LRTDSKLCVGSVFTALVMGAPPKRRGQRRSQITEKTHPSHSRALRRRQQGGGRPGRRNPEKADFVSIRKYVSSDSADVRWNSERCNVPIRNASASDRGSVLRSLASSTSERCPIVCFAVRHHNSNVTVANRGAGCKRLFGRGTIVPGKLSR